MLISIELDVVLKCLREQHDLRRELQGLGSSEVSESWDTLKYNLEQEIKKATPYYVGDILAQIRSS